MEMPDCAEYRRTKSASMMLLSNLLFSESSSNARGRSWCVNEALFGAVDVGGLEKGTQEYAKCRSRV